MNRKRILLFLLLVVLLYPLSAQNEKVILVADRDITATKKIPVQLTYGLKKGDKLRLSLTTNKSKEIDLLKILVGNNQVFIKKDFVPTTPIELTIMETNFVHFIFEGPTFGRDISVKIERIPSNETDLYFNTALEIQKSYITTYQEYEEDSIIGYDKPEYRPNNFRVIDDVSYESKKIDEKKHKMKGGGNKGILIKKPQDTIREPNKISVFIGYQVMITSAAAEDKMWKYIESGIDVGTLALSLALPVAGTVGGLAINTTFEMIGPQKNGEPVYYSIMEGQAELDQFLINKNPSCYEYGSATGYSSTWPPYKSLAIGIRNLNIATDVQASIAVYGIYQVTSYKEEVQNTVILRPKIVKVKKKRTIVENKKQWVFQK